MSEHLTEVRIVVAQCPKSRKPRPIYKFLVRIRSNMRDPALWTNVTIDPGDLTSKEIPKAINLAGCSAAEHLCKEYGDHMDCEAAGRLVLGTFNQLMLEIHHKNHSILDISRMEDKSGPGLYHQEVL